MHDADDGRTENSPANADPQAAPAGEPAGKPVSPAAERALAEAAARHAEIDRKSIERPTEVNGRGGLEPVRFGDWEIKGIACDF